MKVPKKLFSMIGVFAMLAALLVPAAALLVPATAFADDSGSSNVTFTAGNEVPGISNVTLKQSGSPVSTMNPQEATVYQVEVEATDANTMDDIDSIVLHIEYDTNDTLTEPSGTIDPNSYVTITWTKPTTWTLAGGTNTTWSITNGTVASDMDLTSGTWTFNFTAGKVATEIAAVNTTGWDFCAKATDGGGSSNTSADASWLLNQSMNWYGELNSLTSSAAFPEIGLGEAWGDSNNITSPIVAKMIANGAYDEKIKTANTTWTGGGKAITMNTTGDPGDNEFALKNDDDLTVDGAVQVTAGYDLCGVDTGSITEEEGVEISNSLFIKLAADKIAQVEFAGIIYYQIVDGE